MEIYRRETETGVKDVFYLVYKRERDAVYTLKVVTGPLGKWGFHKFPEEKFDKFYSKKSQYKGTIDQDVARTAFNAIFTVPAKTLRDGPETWS